MDIKKLRILLNTKYESAVTSVAIENIGLRYANAGHHFKIGDWGNYRDYDMIMFLAPDSEVIKAKKQNTQTLVGIMDPKVKTSRSLEEVKKADFLAVSSIEQADYFMKFNENIIVYHWFPCIKPQMKEHKNGEKILIGYHGNKIHLNTFYPFLQKALERLSIKYKIELMAIYNIKKLGKWGIGVPKNILVHHIQWEEKTYCDYLKDCDIGLVPSFIPINRKSGLCFSRVFENTMKSEFGYNAGDYLLRFKYSTNPNRIYEFSQLGIPVVADMFPSACQFIVHGKSGFLVHSQEGWYNALEKLINSVELRNSMSKSLREFVDTNHSPSINFKKFAEFINLLAKRKG